MITEQGALTIARKEVCDAIQKRITNTHMRIDAILNTSDGFGEEYTKAKCEIILLISIRDEIISNLEEMFDRSELNPLRNV